MKVLLAVPAFTGFVHTLVVEAQNYAIRYIDKNYPHVHLDYRFLQRTMVDRARQSCHEYALNHGYDYIMWWDDDIIAPENTIAELLSHKKDIVSAMLFVRTEPHPMYAYRAEDLDNLETYRSITLKQRDGLMQVDAVGTGCTLMKTDIVKDWPKPWWRWPKQGAEDIAFCVKHRRAGGEIFVDTNIATKHLDHWPSWADEHAHRRSCLEMKQLVEDNPDIKKNPEFHKVDYLIKGALNGSE